MRGTEICQRNSKISCTLHKINPLDFAWNYKVVNIYQMNISKTELAANKSKVPTICHVYSIQICSKQMPRLYEWSFQAGSKYENKHKMKHYYLNDLSNPNLWNVGRFDYALAIIKNIFLFVKQIFLHLFCPPAFFWLMDHNENKAIRLICVILTILFFISLILLLTSTFFYLWLIFLLLVI